MENHTLSGLRKKLTDKQRAFVDHYAGNAAEAASLAGYKGNRKALSVVGSNNLKHPVISRLITNRDKTENQSGIASRQELQRWWTKVLRDEREEMTNRIKVADHLAKSHGAYLERIDHTTKGDKLPTVTIYLPENYRDPDDED